MPGHHPDIAVGNIMVVFVRVDTTATAVDNIDHFVTVNDAFRPGRSRDDFLLEPRTHREINKAFTKLLLNGVVQRQNTGLVLADRG